MNNISDIISARRESVIKAYESAKAENYLRYLEGDEKATAEYIFDNQKIDANNIVSEFYNNNRRIISITKKTKIGMDGLMIEIAKLMTTHSDDLFIVNPLNVRIITGMSNAGWEKDMKEKSPNCFKDKIFHHGKLGKADLNNLENALIIIDEIDTGDKEFQVLHNTLKSADVLNIAYMEQKNIRFVIASATMIKALYELYKWGELHYLYKMTIPSNYIGHIDFLNKGIIKDFYAINTIQKANEWIETDIINNYGLDFRVHIARVTNKTVTIIETACMNKNIIFKNHTSTDRLIEDEINELFKEPLNKHIVLCVKGFFRRANLIPNKWKLRIGATHEYYTKKVDNNVQIQGLPGRMTGYWKDIIDSGYKTGPHRTSIKAIQEYERVFNDPFGRNSYTTSGFNKKDGNISSQSIMLSPKNITGLIEIDLPKNPEHICSKPIHIIDIYSNDIIDSIKENIRNINFIKNIIQKYDHISIFNIYDKYEWRFWNMDTPEKCTKWGLNRMKEIGAYSTETNIRKEEKDKDIMMVYIYDKILILSPWNGTISRN